MIRKRVDLNSFLHSVSHLEEVAEDFLIENFNLTLDIPIRISNRMSSTFGKFVLTRDRATGETKSKEIVISRNLYNYHGYYKMIDTLKHECIHYALYTLGRPYKDGQAYFENTLKEHGVSSTGTHRYKGKAHLYTCKSCDNSFKQKRRFNTDKYVCSHCKGQLEYVKQVIVK